MFAKNRPSVRCWVTVLGLLGALAAPHAGRAQTRAEGEKVQTGASTTRFAEKMYLGVGEQRVIPTDKVRSYSEGIKGIVDVRLSKDGSEFVIVGVRPGTTTLLLLMLDGTEHHIQLVVPDIELQAEAEDSKKVSVAPRDNVRLDFYFVQLNRNHQHQIGMRIPTVAGPGLRASYDFTTSEFESARAVVSDQPLPSLDLAQASGFAKVMREAAVIVANGEKAVFSAGGEINVMVAGGIGGALERVEYGSLVEVEPFYDQASGRIELRVHADVSELESDRGTGVPGRMRASLHTLVNMELGQSLILAGLSARSERKSKAGLPLLGQIPILGALFGHHEQATEETENIVIIVPTVVDAVSMSARSRISRALSAYEEFQGNLDQVEFLPRPRGGSRAAPDREKEAK